ncbi:MAG: nicotinamide-nucleotide amidase [Glaciecola sp.]
MQNLTAKTVESLSHTLGQELLARGKKVSSVESCTGGGVAFAITEVAGSSQWFERSWVTYSNQAKNEEVNVSLDTLAMHGAVSSEVVLEMAQGGLLKSAADLCVSISGIAGPGGGTATKSVGLVWFAIATANNNRSFSRCFSGDRYQVRQQAIGLALTELIDSLVNS